MTDHQICDACECVNHCRKNGCIPIAQAPTNSALHMMEGQGEAASGDMKDERAAFKKAYEHLDLHEIPNPWGKPMFFHSHVEALWDGWSHRAGKDKTALSHFADEVEASGEAEKHAMPCSYCDDSGDVHGITGEWRGVCHCPAGQAIKARMTAAPGAAVAAREQDELVAYGHRTYGHIVKAAISLIAEVQRNHETKPPPLKYAVPYGAVVALQEALTAKPLPAIAAPHFAIPPSNDVATLQQELALAYEGLERERGITKELAAALKELADDISERFDMDSHSTNLGMRNAVKEARAALSKVQQS